MSGLAAVSNPRIPGGWKHYDKWTDKLHWSMKKEQPNGRNATMAVLTTLPYREHSILRI